MENKLKKISVISSDKILQSRKFNDFYFNSINPANECKYVYIDSNNLIEKLKNEIGDERVICGLSGGVDSTVTALLLHRAIKNNLTCIFVDNGFLESKKLIR